MPTIYNINRVIQMMEMYRNLCYVMRSTLLPHISGFAAVHILRVRWSLKTSALFQEVIQIWN